MIYQIAQFLVSDLYTHCNILLICVNVAEVIMLSQADHRKCQSSDHFGHLSTAQAKQLVE